MEVIVAVLKDLYLFAVRYRFGLFTPVPLADTVVKDYTETLKEVSKKALVSPEAPQLLTHADISTKEPVEESREEDVFQSVGYAFIGEAFLYALPTRSFDGVVARIPYGESFQILNSQGKWLNVLYQDLKGWIHLDDVTRSNADLNPHFIAGEVYREDHPSTIKLRTRIDDQFHTTQLSLPLQNVEYVTYRLFRKGNTVAWPPERPRVAGTWQRLLKGVHGVHIGVTPKTTTIMEYINPDNTGHVAFVESVYPDSAITISEIGYPSEGVYSERTMSRDEWKELRPVFIEVA